MLVAMALAPSCFLQATASRTNDLGTLGQDSALLQHQRKLTQRKLGRETSAEPAVICYFTNWARYRTGLINEAKDMFEIGVDGDLCTHFMYGFVKVTPDFSLKSNDPNADHPSGSESQNGLCAAECNDANFVTDWNDPNGVRCDWPCNPSRTMRGYEGLTVGMKAKNPNIKALVSVGGWNFNDCAASASATYGQGSSTCEIFSTIAASETNIRQFAKNVVEFCDLWGFDGFDLDWEYPVVAGHNSNAKVGGEFQETPQDYANYINMLKILKEEFATARPSNPLLLTAAVGVGKATADSAYNIPELTKHLDLINLMTYDLHGAWESKVACNANLYATDLEGGGVGSGEAVTGYPLSVSWAVDYWLAAGADASKVVLGLATYGRGWKLSNPSESGYNAAASGASSAGQCTKEAGYLSSYEVAELLRSGDATEHYDEERECPYIVTTSGEWVGYDNERSLTAKVNFLKSKGLRGAMFWALDLDDFAGNFNAEGQRFPLISLVGELLRDGTSPAATTTTQAATTTIAPAAASTTTSVASTTSDSGVVAGSTTTPVGTAGTTTAVTSTTAADTSTPVAGTTTADTSPATTTLASTTPAVATTTVLGSTTPVVGTTVPAIATTTTLAGAGSAVACVRNQDCTVNAWCADTGYDQWCASNYAVGGTCIDTFCVLTSAGSQETTTAPLETTTTVTTATTAAPATTTPSAPASSSSSSSSSSSTEAPISDSTSTTTAPATAAPTTTSAASAATTTANDGPVACLRNTNCEENAWCDNEGYDTWCTNNYAASGTCPATYCMLTGGGDGGVEPTTVTVPTTTTNVAESTTVPITTTVAVIATTTGAASTTTAAEGGSTTSVSVEETTTTAAPSPSPSPSPGTSEALAKVVEMLEASTSTGVFQYDTGNGWVDSDLYTWSDMVKAVEIMVSKGVGSAKLWVGETSADVRYGLVNIAAFLAQCMQETIQYNACDENNWSDPAVVAQAGGTTYSAVSACGQLHQSYQDYTCSAEEDAVAGGQMACDVDPDMETRAATQASWYGAPPKLFCAPKSKVPAAPRWNYMSPSWCSPDTAAFADDVPLDEYFDYVNAGGGCKDYQGIKAGGWTSCGAGGCEGAPAPLFGRESRTDVEGCCWWGRGVIQTTGVCNFGKLNYYMGKRAADEGRSSLFPSIDFCRRPGAICEPDSPGELKWIAGFFYWLNAVQPYNQGSWNYLDELKAWVDSGMNTQDSSFINGASGIVNRGCHNPPNCGTGELHAGAKRAENFRKVLQAMNLV